MPYVDLKSLFMAKQAVLSAALNLNRAHIGHSTTKGECTELDWAGMLTDFLPKRYAVESAFILDCNGESSEQIDLVIYDPQYCPLLLKKDGALYVPAESVYAALEVKQEFSKGVIEYAGKKVASVRRLHRTSAPIYHAGGRHEPKQPFRILAGVLALDSEWSPGLGTPFETAICQLEDDQRLDLGCSLKHGAFEAIYPEDDAPRIEVSEPDTALIFFCLRLMQRLQQLGTVVAIDLREYSKGL